MTADDLRIYAAIYQVEQELEQEGNDGIGKERWSAEEQSRAEMSGKIQKYLNQTDDDLIARLLTYRKSGGKKRIAAQLMLRFGPVCFYAGRGLGPCSPNFDIDRIDAGGDYTVRNCILACETHNRQRGDIPLVDYLKSGKDTDDT